MEFEWDEAKRRSNLEKHGVDFEVAAMIFLGPRLTAKDARSDYGETRYVSLGVALDVHIFVVFTMRGPRVRLISAWKAGRHDQRRYQAYVAAGHPREA